ncbi:hypothetical protein BJY18_005688 [Amycolatopsis jiangsuensis]|uniref:Alpha/beta hydrolase family protein n=2 Tax=Amycolatopsis jiangsuensis TaxID=1181879 RepID=A0A840J2V0_9PSEU|nr:hypothetical protein [Amycolatopsis jiangsuensis]
MPRELAEELEGEHDEGMSAAMLALYRSAVPNLHADWGTQLPARMPAPGLVLSPNGHPFNEAEQTEEMAAKVGAQLAVLEGLGHSWMVTHPATVAPILTTFWNAQAEQQAEHHERSAVPSMEQ